MREKTWLQINEAIALVVQLEARIAVVAQHAFSRRVDSNLIRARDERQARSDDEVKLDIMKADLADMRRRLAAMARDAAS